VTANPDEPLILHATVLKARESIQMVVIDVEDRHLDPKNSVLVLMGRCCAPGAQPKDRILVERRQFGDKFKYFGKVKNGD
jgi:hypothetical protein